MYVIPDKVYWWSTISWKPYFGQIDERVSLSPQVSGETTTGHSVEQQHYHPAVCC